jgi:hypothetical protein
MADEIVAMIFGMSAAAPGDSCRTLFFSAARRS